jgi:SAM-dependent methyltransferase
MPLVIQAREIAAASAAWRRNREHRRAETSGWPLPPGRLVYRIAGTADLGWHVESGRRAATSLEECLRRQGVEIGALSAILDFGCGCGRLLRQWSRLPARLHGCDYDREQIAWDRSQLRFATFEPNMLSPPLPYPDNSFDLVTALSVFTHLPESFQIAWFRELGRVLVPGGYLALSLHGSAYLEQLTPDERGAFLAGRVVIRQAPEAGSNRCAAYHPPGALEGLLASEFVVLESLAVGAAGNPNQDLILLRSAL